MSHCIHFILLQSKKLHEYLCSVLFSPLLCCGPDNPWTHHTHECSSYFIIHHTHECSSYLIIYKYCIHTPMHLNITMHHCHITVDLNGDHWLIYRLGTYLSGLSTPNYLQKDLNTIGKSFFSCVHCIMLCRCIFSYNCCDQSHSLQQTFY